MKLGERAEEVRRAIKAKRPLPQWYLDEPPIDDHNARYIEGYWRICKDTPPGLNGRTPISWLAAWRYARDTMELPNRNAKHFASVVEHLDGHFVELSKGVAMKRRNTQSALASAQQAARRRPRRR